MHKTTLLDIDLRLFDGAAGAAAGGEAAGEGAAQATAGTLPKAETKGRSGSSRRSRAGELSNVVYGKQDTASPAAEADVSSDAGSNNGEGNANKSGVETTSDTLEAKRKAFKDLIDGEYKDQYAEMFQKSFDRRFKDMKGMEADLNSQKPIIDMLMQRYNIGDGDISKLQTAIEKDDVYWEDAAEKAGMTVDQFKTMQRLERENAEYVRRENQRIGQEQARQKLNEWYQASEKVKELYPSFDFRVEMNNKDFSDLLKSGIPVQKAYELCHMDEIKAAAAKTAAQAAGEQMVAKLKSKASRPLENGTSSQSAAIVKNDVHSLTRADRAEVVRRAQRGERISF